MRWRRYRPVRWYSNIFAILYRIRRLAQTYAFKASFWKNWNTQTIPQFKVELVPEWLHTWGAHRFLTVNTAIQPDLDDYTVFKITRETFFWSKVCETIKNNKTIVWEISILQMSQYSAIERKLGIFALLGMNTVSV